MNPFNEIIQSTEDGNNTALDRISYYYNQKKNNSNNIKDNSSNNGKGLSTNNNSIINTDDMINDSNDIDISHKNSSYNDDTFEGEVYSLVHKLKNLIGEFDDSCIVAKIANSSNNNTPKVHFGNNKNISIATPINGNSVGFLSPPPSIVQKHPFQYQVSESGETVASALDNEDTLVDEGTHHGTDSCSTMTFARTLPLPMNNTIAFNNTNRILSPGTHSNRFSRYSVGMNRFSTTARKLSEGTLSYVNGGKFLTQSLRVSSLAMAGCSFGKHEPLVNQLGFISPDGKTPNKSTSSPQISPDKVSDDSKSFSQFCIVGIPGQYIDGSRKLEQRSLQPVEISYQYPSKEDAIISNLHEYCFPHGAKLYYVDKKGLDSAMNDANNLHYQIMHFSDASGVIRYATCITALLPVDTVSKDLHDNLEQLHNYDLASDTIKRYYRHYQYRKRNKLKSDIDSQWARNITNSRNSRSSMDSTLSELTDARTAKSRSTTKSLFKALKYPFGSKKSRKSAEKPSGTHHNNKEGKKKEGGWLHIGGANKKGGSSFTSVISSELSDETNTDVGSNRASLRIDPSIINRHVPPLKTKSLGDTVIGSEKKHLSASDLLDKSTEVSEGRSSSFSAKDILNASDDDSCVDNVRGGIAIDPTLSVDNRDRGRSNSLPNVLPSDLMIESSPSQRPPSLIATHNVEVLKGLEYTPVSPVGSIDCDDSDYDNHSNKEKKLRKQKQVEQEADDGSIKSAARAPVSKLPAAVLTQRAYCVLSQRPIHTVFFKILEAIIKKDKERAVTECSLSLHSAFFASSKSKSSEDLGGETDRAVVVEGNPAINEKGSKLEDSNKNSPTISSLTARSYSAKMSSREGSLEVGEGVKAANAPHSRKLDRLSSKSAIYLDHREKFLKLVQHFDFSPIVKSNWDASKQARKIRASRSGNGRSSLKRSSISLSVTGYIDHLTIETNQLTLKEWTSGLLISLIPSELIVKILSLLLQEQSLLVFGSHPGLVTAITTAFVQLLDPFTWEGIFVPLLPTAAYEALDAPVPYVIGLVGSSKPNVAIAPTAGVLYLDDFLNHGDQYVPTCFDEAAGTRITVRTLDQQRRSSADRNQLVYSRSLRFFDTPCAADDATTNVGNGGYMNAGAHNPIAVMIEPTQCSLLKELNQFIAYHAAKIGESSKQHSRLKPRLSVVTDIMKGVMYGMSSESLRSLRQVLQRILTHNSSLCGEVMTQPGGFKKFGVVNSHSGWFEFLPELFMEPLRTRLNFQESVINTQLFVSFMDRKRVEYMAQMNSRIFIGDWIYYRVLLKKSRLKSRRKQTFPND